LARSMIEHVYNYVFQQEARTDRLDPGSERDDEAAEARGHMWLVFWSLGGDDVFCSMTDGSVCLDVVNPHEWQDLYAEADRPAGDEATACDLACERLIWLMQQRDRAGRRRVCHLPG